MKKILLIALLAYGANVYATFPLIDIQNLEGSFLEQKGHAYAEFANYTVPYVKISHKEIEITFNKKERHLVLRDPNSTVELEFDFSFLNVFRSFEFTNTLVKSTPRTFQIKSDFIDVFVDKKKFKIFEFNIEADISNVSQSDAEKISILDGFLKKSLLEIRKLKFGRSSRSFLEMVEDENPKLSNSLLGISVKKVPLIIRHLKFSIEDGHFKGAALLDSYLNMGIRFFGVVKLNKDESELKIIVRTAKMGYFSVKRSVLKLVREMNLPNVVVKKNTIYVNLKGMSAGRRKPLKR